MGIDDNPFLAICTLCFRHIEGDACAALYQTHLEADAARGARVDEQEKK